MAAHESSVNFQNLIRDLAEMYPFDIADVVVVELIANSLDAGSTRIWISYDPQRKILVIQDNGRGMNKSQFAEYHDFAAGLKKRGTGIGFAGLGAKVSFNIADRVITETCSKTLSIGSNWFMESKKKLIWEDIKATHLSDPGTRVEVHFRDDVFPTYETTDGMISLLRRHYLPLLDTKFLELYDRMKLYSNDLRFVVNEEPLEPGRVVEDFSLDKVKEFFPERRKKEFGYGVFGLAESEYPIASDVCGVLLCTYGKVIKAELFNQFPSNYGPQIVGVVEIPEFVKYLTTSKTDFIRIRKRREFEQLYNPIRQEFKDWLSSLGIEPSEITGTGEAIELEREIKKIVGDVPELSEFFGFWLRKNVLQKDDKGIIPAVTKFGVDLTFPVGNGEKGEGSGILDEGDEVGQATVEDKEGAERAKAISRKAPRGPKIAFSNAPDRIELGWVEGTNIVINSGHPSYIKSSSNSKTRRLHSLFAIAGVIHRFIGSESEAPDFMFIDRMMAAWGNK
ncbi:MAG: ATP-binding protein [Candidatus Bathyarchaeia archaeon]